jgi:serine phosphatase RsbU (regulator of sigma subunit)/putative methionine-R-sulfoxide reductase with GAF domain
VEALAALADAGARVAAAATLGEALDTLTETLLASVQADVAVVYVLDPAEQSLVAAAIATTSPSVGAELEGTHFPVAELDAGEADKEDALPAPIARAARRSQAVGLLQLPLHSGDKLVGALDLLRTDAVFDGMERSIARVVAMQAELAVQALGGAKAATTTGSALVLAGDALAAGADGDTARHVVRLVAAATGARASLLWRRAEPGSLQLVASAGLDPETDARIGHAREAAERANEVERLADASGTSVALQLGQPSDTVLQLLFAADTEPTSDDLARLRTFGVRASQALRASGRARTIEGELERTRALLAVVAQATAQLSLAHTLETAVDRVAELFGVERLGVYLADEEDLHPAAGTGLAGPHVRLAQRLLELASGPLRGRGLVEIADVTTDPRLAVVADAAAETGVDSAIAVPLVVGDETIGLLGVFPDRGRALTENEAALLRALAAQLAVAVQNAQLHEQTKMLGEERERALDAERASARQLRGLYEISRSFAQSLSLEATLEAVARTVTDVLDVDLAAILMPDDRREQLVPRAIHIGDARLAEVTRTIFWRKQPFGTRPVQRLFRLGEPVTFNAAAVRRMGAPATALEPFLERGWSGALVPIATPAEVLAALLLVSTRPANRVTAQTIDSARAIGGQAALAIDNARLYQQQKEFSDTMQRSLLPRSLPQLPGLEVGDAYQSSARVEVGGDVYDFVELDEGRLAVVLGDVTGHGIEAAADMAMAKFVFRSLAREHPRPGDFLSAANEVVVGEIAPGKFISMVYLLVDAKKGHVAAAGAGHPQPRVVSPDGPVRGLDVRGLVLGIEAGQTYEEVTSPLEPGSSVVLYTDGVLEARSGSEFYGFERLDAIISAGRELSARDLAETILADCRDFAKNELADDCAVVVVKRRE